MTTETTTAPQVEGWTDLTVEDYFPADKPIYSPYGLCKVVNRVLGDVLDDPKPLPPQMFYTYAGKGMLGNKGNADRKVLTRGQAVAWTDNYVTKRVAKAKEAVEDAEA